MALLDTLQERYPVINKAAGQFIRKLTLGDMKKDIMIAAEMAGLLLLRNSPVAAHMADLTPGSALFGAVSEEAYTTMNRFVAGCAASNGMDPTNVSVSAIPAESRAYLKELTRYEPAFYEICQTAGIERELFPFVAAACALKLVAAGKLLGALDENTGQAMVIFHIVAGSKMIPYPPIAKTEKEERTPIPAQDRRDAESRR